MEGINTGLRAHQGNHPNLVVCHICGREYGSKSLSIHQKACTEKWHKEQMKYPKSQRKQLPVAPSDIPLGTSAGGNQAYNEQALQTFLEEGRDECPHCSRKFLRDRLVIHLRSCKPGGYFAKQSALKKEQTSQK